MPRLHAGRADAVRERLAPVGKVPWVLLGATALDLFHGPAPVAAAPPPKDARLVAPDLARVPSFGRWLAAFRKADGTPALEALRAQALPEDLHDLASVRARLAEAPELWGVTRPTREELAGAASPHCLVELGVGIAGDASARELLVDFVTRLAQPANRDRIFGREGFVPAEALAGVAALPAPSLLEVDEARLLWTASRAPAGVPITAPTGDQAWIDTVLLGGACVVLVLLIWISRRGQ
ncbi:MAG: hypothetical protein R3F30_12420 [Planctomycetota bacterium]